MGRGLFWWVLGALALTPKGFAGAPLVTKAAIARQLADTEVFSLANGIKVVHRHLPASAISTLSLNYRFGAADLPYSERSQAFLLFAALGYGAVGYPPAELSAALKASAAGISCQVGLEMSQCLLGVVDDYWPEMLRAFAAVTQKPLFEPAVVARMANGRMTSLEKQLEDPGLFVNEVVNRGFYPEDHPYKLFSFDEISQLKRINAPKLHNLHQRVSHSQGQFLTYVGSLTIAELKPQLEKAFGGIPLKETFSHVAKPPVFQRQQAVAMEAWPVSQTYIHMKFNAPGRSDDDHIISGFLARILRAKFADAVLARGDDTPGFDAFVIDHALGVGVIQLVTSRPEADLKLLAEVIKDLKTEGVPDAELERKKSLATTGYFLAIEEHARLAAALAEAYYFGDDLAAFYHQPRELAAVDPARLKEAASRYLVNFRVGVIAPDKAFKEEWVTAFVKSHEG